MTPTSLETILVFTFLTTTTGVNGVRKNNSKDVLRRVRRQVDESCQVADIVFVLDSSGSIGQANWELMLNFTESIVTEFTIGADNVQIGVNYYGNEARLAFNLNTYDNEQDVLEAIGRIPWLDQNTNTSGGIRLMHRDMFVSDSGARGNAPRIGIVITDGESTFDKNLTIPEADIARSKGITLFAIGIGDAISQDELMGIASKPPEQFVFNAQSFEALGAIKQEVVTTACGVAAECRASGDLVIILDSSGSVGPLNFDNMRQFVLRLIREATIDEGGTRIGLMIYSSNAQVMWHLNSFSTRDDMTAALVDQVLYSAGTTNTANALSVARDTMFTQQNGDRADVNNAILLFTDGGSDDFSKTIEEARRTRLSGIKTFVVAVTNWVNELEIKEIASDPDGQNAFFVTDFDQLSSIYQPLKRTICDDADDCVAAACENGGTCVNGVSRYLCQCAPEWAGMNCDIRCPNSANVVIVLDSSASIGRRSYYMIQDFAKYLVQFLNVNDRDGGHNVALITYSNQAFLRLTMKQYTNKADVIDSISFPYIGRTTNNTEALRVIIEEAFQNGNPSARKIAIIISDGQSPDPGEAFQQAARAHSVGISILGIGINVKNRFARQQLESFVSDPDDMNYMEVDLSDPEALYALAANITRTVCNDVDECASNPCQGGSTCVDKLNGYECLCPSGRSGINCERECDGRLDVAFLVDSSGSIREDRYQIVLDFIANVTEFLEVRATRTHVGAAIFSDSAVMEFPLGRYREKEDVLYALSTLPYIRGRTNTADGLRMLYRQMFNSTNGDRDDVPNVAFVITDGLSNVNKDRTIPEAIVSKLSGIHIIVASVEIDTDNLELKGIASRPASSNMYVVDRFHQMYTIAESLSMSLCDNVNECLSNPCVTGSCVDGLHTYRCLCPSERTGKNCERTCTRMLDVVFLLDASGSLQQFDTSQDLARYLAMGLNFNGARVRLGVITYQATEVVQFDLSKYTTQMEVIDAIAFSRDNSIRGTNTASAIRRMRTDVFQMNAGDRAGVDNIAIVFSDGQSNIERQNLATEIREARRQGVRMMAVGIGDDIDRSELDKIGDEPNLNNVFYVRNSTEVQAVGNMILDELCS